VEDLSTLIKGSIDVSTAIFNLSIKETDPEKKKTLEGFQTRNAKITDDSQKLVTSANVTTLENNRTQVEFWRDRSARTVALKPEQWQFHAELVCHPQWFGRTEGQTISLSTIDVSQASAQPASIPLTSNSCLPTLTVSSGIGASGLRNSTYGFVPTPDDSTKPPSTKQVIGYATDSRVTPIYVGQMNYEYVKHHPVGLHISGGVGVGSTSAGNSAEFFIGHGFSFARRAIFVTPAFDISQRQTLRDGYHLGDDKGSLDTVPVINRTQYGWLVTFTFPVLSK
jgi:hypothetical protein